MANTYLDQTGLNTRKTLPTSRLGTRNIVWYSFYISYDLLRGEEPDNYTTYDSSDSFYHAIVERIQEAAELYHLGAPTVFFDNGFVFGIVDNGEREPDPDYFNVAYGTNPFVGSVNQALYQFFGGSSGWGLNPCFDMGFGIVAPY
jgi:hypothetical protein